MSAGPIATDIVVAPTEGDRKFDPTPKHRFSLYRVVSLLLMGAVAMAGFICYIRVGAWSLGPFRDFMTTLSLTVALCITFIGVIYIVSALGSDFFTKNHGLDLAISVFTWIPWVLGAWHFGWIGLIAALVGELAVFFTFCRAHALAHPGTQQVITLAIHDVIGSWRNFVGLWATVVVVPVFLLIRAGEIFVYPILVRTVNLPQYNMEEWVNVSRQKFDGLIAQDLLWCLYCDWMTGVYSLGAEMLRNVESFWCPIKFYGKKCDNCKIDFPDLNEWVAPEGTMEEVVELWNEKYRGHQPHSWFGHEERRD